MSDIPPKPDSMSEEFYAACLSVTAKRARTVILHMLSHGFITTEELSDLYHYDHAPRASRDVRENGIPLETFKAISSKTGRTIAAYRFADPANMVAGRLGGRKAFSKKFKDKLVARYESRSLLTNEILEPRYLQIDHRIPYEVAGNDSAENIESYMLLDASAQRAKSWSCEQCENFRVLKDPIICQKCFWAFPENYIHVAMRPERRLDIVWSGAETTNYDQFLAFAKSEGQSPQEAIKLLLSKYLNGVEESASRFLLDNIFRYIKAFHRNIIATV